MLLQVLCVFILQDVGVGHRLMDSKQVPPWPPGAGCSSRRCIMHRGGVVEDDAGLLQDAGLAMQL
jgi:hypothetical protein